MTKDEWQAYLSEIFPDEIMGFVRPDEPIPQDVDFSTKLPQFIRKDPVGFMLMNAILRQLLSNDSLLKQWTDQLFTQMSEQDFKIATETVKGLMSPEMLKKLNGITAGANNYVHPNTHPAPMITEDASHRFTTDAEKNIWNAKASTAIVSTTANGLCPQRNGSTASFLRGDGTWQTPPGTYAHPGTHPATMITEDASRRFVSDTEKGTWNGKAGTATATQSTNGLMSVADKKKLDGVAAGATAYTHPSSHPANMITEDSNRRFVSDAEKGMWNGKADALHGTHIPAPQAANNAVFLRNDNTWATITAANIGAVPVSHARTYTPLIDWTAMENARYVNTQYPQLNGKPVKNINNTGAGIVAYGGDTAFNGMEQHSILLKESYLNYDEMLFVFTNDEGDYVLYRQMETETIKRAFEQFSRVMLSLDCNLYWCFWCKNKKEGWDHPLSTDVLWRGNGQNCGIIEIYGVR